jgi:DNA polymerase-4
VPFTEPILHVDMDAFFVEVERLRRPELRGRPVAVGGDGRRGVVASASYEARARGVRSAMSSVEARRRCPELTFVPADHGVYGETSARVFEVFRSFTPLVEGISVDEAFLDVSGLRHHYGSVAEIAEAVRRDVRRRTGLPASVGIAASKFVAKLASAAAKPDGVRLVPVESQLDFLWALPASALWGVGEATMAALARLGIETVGDLAGTPVRVLERELGPTVGRHLAALAHAEDSRPVVPDTAAKSVSAEQTYAVDLGSTAEVLAEVRTHAERVARRLRRSGLVGRTVTVKIRFADFTTATRSETLADPTDTAAEIDVSAGHLAAKILDGRSVRLVGVGIGGLASAGAPAQLTVDHDPRRRALESALDAVHDRFGDSAGVRRGFER